MGFSPAGQFVGMRRDNVSSLFMNYFSKLHRPVRPQRPDDRPEVFPPDPPPGGERRNSLLPAQALLRRNRGYPGRDRSPRAYGRRRGHGGMACGEAGGGGGHRWAGGGGAPGAGGGSPKERRE